MRADSKRFYAGLGAVVVLGFAVRLFYAYHYKWDQAVWGDSFYYHYQAVGLVKGLGFLDPYAGPRWLTGFANQYHRVGVHPGAEHPPLYTLFLAIPSALGFQTFREHMIASTILGSMTVGMVGIAARSIVNARVGILAAFIAAVYANLWINDGLVMSETIAGFAVAIVIYWVYRCWREPTFKSAAWLGVSCGVLALTRAEIAIYLPLVAIPLVWRAAGFDLARKLKMLGVIALLAFLPVSPWLARNLTKFEHPVLFSTAFDIGLSNTNCNYTWYGERLGYWDLRCTLDVHPKGDPSQQALQYRRDGLDYIGSHLTRIPVVVAARVGMLWEVFHPFRKIAWDSFEQGRGPHKVTWLALIQYYLLAPFAVAGVFVLRRRRIIVYPLVMLAVVATISAVLVFANPRYRTPAEIGMLILAAAALDAGATALVGRRRRRATDPAEAERAREMVGAGAGTAASSSTP